MFTKTPTFAIDPPTRDALSRAASRGDTEEIDKITDRLAQQGVCRPRSDISRMGDWVARRAMRVEHVAPIVTAAGKADIGSEIAAQFHGIFARAAQ